MMNELKELLNEGGVSMDKDLLTSEGVIEEGQDSNFAVKADEEKKDDKKDGDEEEKCPKCGKPKSECECKDEDDEDKKKFAANDPEDKEDKKDEDKCPECGKMMLEKGNQLVCMDNMCGYVEKLKKM